MLKSQTKYFTFAFEDLWPVKGDYDFNDMVIGYRYTNVLNSDNKSVRFKMSFTIRAVGAANHSGFGIELDVDPTLIASVSGHKTDGQNTTLNAKGLEAQQNKSVIIVFNDREIIMHNNIFNTSSSFNIEKDEWTSFNENYIDKYICKKKRY